MTTLEQIYWIFAIPFSIIFIIQLLVTILSSIGDSGLDNSENTELNVEVDSGIGFQFISLKNFIAFFAVFGWTGVGCINAGLGNGLSIFISIIAGLIMMFIMAGLFYLGNKLVDKGNMKMESTIIGKTAIVNLRIPANKGGSGKVQINIQGMKTLDAMTDNNEDIKSGSLVKIVGISKGNILLVELL